MANDPGLLGASFLSVVAGALMPGPIGQTLIAVGIGVAAWEVARHNKFNRLWDAMSIGTPSLIDKRKTNCGTAYTFSMSPGMTFERVEKAGSAISAHLNKDVVIQRVPAAPNLFVVEEVDAVQDYYDYEQVPCRGPLEFPIGHDRRGKIVTVDLSKGEPHMLIAGETGGGKSTALRTIITNIITTKPRVRLHLLDMKQGAEFQIFANCKNVVDFAKNRDTAEGVLHGILAEVDRRYSLFADRECVDIGEYNRKYGKLDYHLVVIDEFSLLQNKKGSIEIIEELAAKARACGIHLIISTQRPDAKVLNGRIKANVGLVLGLKTMNDINSRIIIDDSGLERLRGNGHGLLKSVGLLTDVQCPYLSPDAARFILGDYLSPKPHTNGAVKVTSVKPIRNIGEGEMR